MHEPNNYTTRLHLIAEDKAMKAAQHELDRSGDHNAARTIYAETYNMVYTSLRNAHEPPIRPINKS